MKAPAAAFVPDASVILKWVLDAEEPRHAAASRVLERWRVGEMGLTVPSLWVYEPQRHLSSDLRVLDGHLLVSIVLILASEPSGLALRNSSDTGAVR